MNWIKLTALEQLEQIKEESKEHPVLIFKHSTSCSISNASLNRLERNWNPEEVGKLKAYFLDLLSYRNISNAIAEQFNVPHQSPQVLLIEDGKAVNDWSHFDINYKEIKDQLPQLS